MIIQLSRIDLIRLCKGIVADWHTPLPSSHVYAAAFQCINDVNGYQYVLNRDFIIARTDVALLQFVQFFSPEVKLIKL